MSRAALMARRLPPFCARLPLCPPSPRPEKAAERRVAAMRGGAPLPIPNREVKPRSGDDTARERGKAARRPPTAETLPERTGRVSCFPGAANPHGITLPVHGFWIPFPLAQVFRRIGGAVSVFCVLSQPQKGHKAFVWLSYAVDAQLVFVDNPKS